MGKEKISALLIEDSQTYVLLIKEILANAEEVDFKVNVASSLAAGIKSLSRKKADVIMLDLMLPDSSGMATLRECVKKAPDIPVIVLTGNSGEDAIEALQNGAQDYLVKGRIPKALLVRSLRYAVERQRLVAEVRRHRFLESRVREMGKLEHLSASPSTSVTASVFGLSSVKESQPGVYRELVDEYGHIMDMALEQRGYKVAHDTSGRLRSVAERLGFMRASPRDVVEVHSEALKEKFKTSNHLKAETYVEEGHMLVLELMGFLAMYYQNHASANYGREGE